MTGPYQIGRLKEGMKKNKHGGHRPNPILMTPYKTPYATNTLTITSHKKTAMKDSQQKIIEDLRLQIEAINHSAPHNDLAAKLRAELQDFRDEIRLTAAYNEAQDKLTAQTIKDLYDELRPAFDVLGLNYVFEDDRIFTTNKATTFLKPFTRCWGSPERRTFEGIMFEGMIYKFSDQFTDVPGWKEFLWKSIENNLKQKAKNIALTEAAVLQQYQED